MPRVKLHKKRKYREFSKLNSHFVADNKMKNLFFFRKGVNINGRHLSFIQIAFLCFIYDLEFFTATYLMRQFGISRVALMKNYIHPAVKEGHVRVVITTSVKEVKDLEEVMFEGERIPASIKRYTLTQKGRMAVTFFNKRMDKVILSELPKS
jgi:hypothetical protein